MLTVLNAEGQQRNLELTVSRYAFPDSSRFVILGRDVTDRLRNQEELDRYRQELERLVAERSEQLEESRAQLRHQERLATVGTLAAGIAHQINNPVGVIVVAAEFASSPKTSPTATQSASDL